MRNIQDRLEKVYNDGYPIIDMQTESILFEDALQRFFSNSGPNGGELCFIGIGGLINDENSDFEKDKDEDSTENFKSLTNILFIGIKGISLMMIQAGRNETMEKAKVVFEKIRIWTRLTPYQRKQKNYKMNNLFENVTKKKYAFLRGMFSLMHHSFMRSADMSYRAKSLHEATLTVLALKQWGLAKGQYPAELNQLLNDKYLKRLPDDPYSNTTLQYKKTDDNFILYSVGADFIDNGGISDPNDRWGEEGADRVYWPITNKQ